MGCSICSKCKWIRNSAFCGTTKLTEKQLYAKNGFCSTYEPKEEVCCETCKYFDTEYGICKHPIAIRDDVGEKDFCNLWWGRD